MIIEVDNKVIDSLNITYLNEYYVIFTYLVSESGIITQLVKPATCVVLLHL